jgi:Inovirus Gp2
LTDRNYGYLSNGMENSHPCKYSSSTQPYEYEMMTMDIEFDSYQPAYEVIDTVDEMQRQFRDSEESYQTISKRLIHNSDGTTSVSDEPACLFWIEKAGVLAKRICKGNHRLVTVDRTLQVMANRDGPSYRLTSLGTAVWDLCRSGLPMIERACPSSRYKGRDSWPTLPCAKPEALAQTESMVTRFNPFIAVMLRGCQVAMPAIRHAESVGMDLSNEKLRQRIEWIVRFVRRCCSSTPFRRIENNRVKLEKKDLRSCCRYMAEGFRQHSKQLVLRVDLYIKPTHKTHEDVRIAEKCMKHYLRALSEDRIVPDVLRWIWKRECGFDRGVHYHLLVALDGHKHQNACDLSIMLGEAWLRRCGHLRSSYFNCWVRRHEYPYNAIGSVHISDWSMLIGIRDAIRYIVKGDGFVMTGHKRNLRRGKMKSSASQPKRGAPRKPSHDMSLVYGILGNPNKTKPVDDQ